MQEVGNKLYR